MIKRAGGESTISTGRGNTMFPDVVLYGNREQSIILQGWELKMPDVPIEDETFIKDAQRKAIALNLNSCLIWNFTYAVLYIRNDDDTFRKVKQWDETNYIHTRNDVDTYRSDWEKLLEKIILEINLYFVSGEFRKSSLDEVFTMMNPDKRLFFAKFNTPSFVNQRLIGLKHKAEYDDLELNHALLNSIYTMFYIEASGFGRGLGVLDINKDSIANSYMLNPKLVSSEDRLKILHAFEKLKSREIRKTDEELCSSDRIEFERTVFKSFGIEEHYENVVNSLLSLQQARSAAK